MRVPGWLSAVSAVALALLPTAAALADDAPSLELARKSVDACRGEEHAKKMRVKWPDLADETPPDGAEVVIVWGYISYELVRMVLRDGKVEAGTVHAARSWFYNREGESFGATTFDVDAERFTLAWNAARRILAASDERIEPEPEDHPRGGGFTAGSHEPVDWIRIRSGPGFAPLHCSDRPSRSYTWDRVRRWDGLRDRAVFDLFATLVPERDSGRRPAAFEAWSDFATAEVRAATNSPDPAALWRDRAFTETCLRVLGEAGDEASESAVAAFDRSLAALDASSSTVEDAREEAGLAATRLRFRLHWNPEDAARTLRSLPKGTWAREDQAKWLRRTFREKDPEGWAAFLEEEATTAGARPGDVAAAAAEIRDLPADRAVPLLQALLAREDPYVRLEAALALHAIDPDDASAKSAVVAIALDRSIACDWRADLTDRWCRNRALDAALDWGGLTAEALRAHVVAPQADDPEFLTTARFRLMKGAATLTDEEVRDAWRRTLDSKRPGQVLAAVHFLFEARDVASKDRMLAALDRIDPARAAQGADAATGDADLVARWRQSVIELGETPSSGE